MMTDKTASNAPEWSVSDLAGALKRTLEDAFGYVRLRGEVSGYRGPHASGHAYFCLKDQGARLEAVIWKTTFARLKIKPQEGLEMIATGRITTFPGKSTYQIVVDSLEPAGIGALMALLDERRRKLTAEGLFETARKRPLPFLPRIVGVVTSPTGAVVRDILHRLKDRFPRRVLVWPVRVQGETSAQEVAAAIRGFNALRPEGKVPRPDVLIIARGGGSLEDLWSFNEEIVVRAAAASDIPLVAAIGHETDWTLIDWVADMRAPTPTAAAEMVVPVRADLAATVNDLARRHGEAALRSFEHRRADLRSAARALPAPDALFAAKRQRLDLASARLKPALAHNARDHEAAYRDACRRLERLSPRARVPALRARLDGLGARLGASRGALLRSEAIRIAQGRERLAALSDRSRRGLGQALARQAAHLSALAALLGSLSYKAVLARGYAIVRDGEGLPVRAAGGIGPGQPLAVEFSDGTVRVTADGAPRPARRKAVLAVQGSLFGEGAG